MGVVVTVTGATMPSPVSVETAKVFLRVNTEDDDQAISDMLAAATEYLEGVTSRTTLKTSYRYESDEWPSGREVELPRSPLIAHTTSTPITVTYIAQGTTTVTTFASSKYIVDTGTEPGRIVLKNAENWPTAALRSAGGFRVAFDAGYASSTSVPVRMKHAVMLLAQHWYDERHPVGSVGDPIALSLNSLIANVQVPSVP